MQEKEEVKQQLCFFYQSYSTEVILHLTGDFKKVKRFFCFGHTVSLRLTGKKGWESGNEFMSCMRQFKQQRHFCIIDTFTLMLSVKQLIRLLIQYALSANDVSVNE